MCRASKSDDFLQRFWDIYERVTAEGVTQVRKELEYFVTLWFYCCAALVAFLRFLKHVVFRNTTSVCTGLTI